MRNEEERREKRKRKRRGFCMERRLEALAGGWGS